MHYMEWIKGADNPSVLHRVFDQAFSGFDADKKEEKSLSHHVSTFLRQESIQRHQEESEEAHFDKYPKPWVCQLAPEG